MATVIGMVFDLGRAMRRKEEFETSRLLDFEFRLRARTAKLFAKEIGMPLDDLAGRIVEQNHESFIARAAAENGHYAAELQGLWTKLESQVRRRLIAERGDPTPNRLG